VTIHLGSEKALGFSNPISFKTEFLTPDYLKCVLTDVYRFNIQQCMTKNTKTTFKQQFNSFSSIANSPKLDPQSLNSN